MDGWYIALLKAPRLTFLVTLKVECPDKFCVDPTTIVFTEGRVGICAFVGGVTNSGRGRGVAYHW